MAKIRVREYDPRQDSSPDTEVHRPGYRNDPPGLSGVILDRRGSGGFRVCPCGCRTKIAGKAQFAVGHDMRLKGILVRAHLLGSPVHVLEPDLVTRLAYNEAIRWNTSKQDWGQMLREASEKQDKAIRNAVARNQSILVGSRWIVRAGTREYIGYVVCPPLTPKSRKVLVEYIDKRGAIHQRLDLLEETHA